jgi:8-oxo-dGTP pyrophosphatase MutT (NUDIX family)
MVDYQKFLDQLSLEFKKPLPGVEAQWEMAHLARKKFGQSETSFSPEKFKVSPPDSAKKAAVLILLYPKPDGIHFLLIQRTISHSTDRHSGQVSFPGGKIEKGESLVDGAKREAWEEVGVNPTEINILGSLTELYIPVSNYLVYPFVGNLHVYEHWNNPIFRKQDKEVTEILETPIEWLFDDNRLNQTNLNLEGGLVLKDVPYFDFHERVVWGATAMILGELRAMLVQ